MIFSILKTKVRPITMKSYESIDGRVMAYSLSV